MCCYLGKRMLLDLVLQSYLSQGRLNKAWSVYARTVEQNCISIHVFVFLQSTVPLCRPTLLMSSMFMTVRITTHVSYSCRRSHVQNYMYSKIHENVLLLQQIRSNLSLCDTSMTVGMNNVLHILFWKKSVATWKIQDGDYFQYGWHVNIVKIKFGKELIWSIYLKGLSACINVFWDGEAILGIYNYFPWRPCILNHRSPFSPLHI
jgi:hypothetical protein